MKNFMFWQKWLLVVSIFIAAFGLVMALFNGTSIFSIFNDQINPVFWATVKPPGAADEFQRWVYGVWGATVSGWGIFCMFIAHYPFRNREVWARNCLVAGMSVWFVLDTAISLYFRVYFNAAFNTIILGMVALPLVLTWNAFRVDALTKN